MRVLLYAGPSPARDQVLSFCGPILRRVATALTLVTGGGAGNTPLLLDAIERLELPLDLPRVLLSFDEDAADALTQAAGQQNYDLAILGRLQPVLQRLLRGPRSKILAQRLEPAVLRVQGRIGAVRRILLASGGDMGTLHSARLAARIAGPLEARVTILHVISQQSLFFEGFEPQEDTLKEFLAGDSPEAATLRDAAAILHGRGVPVELRGRAGSVLDGVLEEARGHDLLLIGAHRPVSPLDRILLEDLAGDLLDLSPVPVILAKW